MRNKVAIFILAKLLQRSRKNDHTKVHHIFSPFLHFNGRLPPAFGQANGSPLVFL